jgi:NadR type nicotinamide-nucleotide adenylyltransferase
MKPVMLKRIAVTGPECTGKSWLAANLAAQYNTVFVPEYSVQYLAEKGAEYSLEDLEQIAKGQLRAEEKMAQRATDVLFTDTDLLVNKIWSKVVFGKVPDWVEQNLISHKYDLYLLCFPDIDWKEGPFRENPRDRPALFEMYEQELLKLGFPFKIVRGKGNQRFENAVTFVQEVLSSDQIS